jgi:hypothetical protein
MRGDSQVIRIPSNTADYEGVVARIVI